MFIRAFTSRIKAIFFTKSFFFCLLVSLAFLMVPFLIDLQSFFGCSVQMLKPAWYYWGADGSGYAIGNAFANVEHLAPGHQFFIYMFLPFVTAISCASCVYDDRKTVRLPSLVSRMGGRTYYYASALAVFLGGTVIILLPLLLEFICFCLACPLSMPVKPDIAMYSLTDSHSIDILELPHYLIPFQINHPYLFNLLYCLIPSLLGGITAVGSFVITLFVRRGKFLSLTILGTLFCLIGFWIPNYILINFINATPGNDLVLWGVTALVILLLEAAFIEIRIRRDEL